jgi:NADH-quinone oxidoreductase subunit K
MALVLWRRPPRSRDCGAAGPRRPTYSNTKELGRLIYTDYVYPFEIAAVMLLVAIIAAIALTLRAAQGQQVPGPGAAGAGAQRPTACAWSRCPTVETRRAAPRRAAGGTADDRHHAVALPGRWARILFAISVVGIFLNRKNVIVLLMAIELMLLAVNMNFIAFSHFLGDMAGQVFVFFILTVAAAESAIGLAILVVLFRNRARSTSRPRRAEGLRERAHAHETLYLIIVPLAPLAGAHRRRPVRPADRARRRALGHHPRRAGRLRRSPRGGVGDVLNGARFNGTVYTWMVVGG